jgi:hypothetical protein
VKHFELALVLCKYLSTYVFMLKGKISNVTRYYLSDWLTLDNGAPSQAAAENGRQYPICGGGKYQFIGHDEQLVQCFMGRHDRGRPLPFCWQCMTNCSLQTDIKKRKRELWYPEIG